MVPAQFLRRRRRSALLRLSARKLAVTQLSLAPDAATDPRIDPHSRGFLVVLNEDPSPFWLLPGPQVRATLTGLQQKTAVDLSGVTTSDVIIGDGAKRVKLYIMKPASASGVLPVILFIHGGVWIAGDFDNHKRFVRDLVVGSGAAAVFPEYTPIPDAVFPTQIEQCYAAASVWTLCSDRYRRSRLRMFMTEHEQRDGLLLLWCRS